MAQCITMQKLDPTVERKIVGTRPLGHSRRVNILRRGRSTRKSSPHAISSNEKLLQGDAESSETNVNDHLQEPFAVLTTVGLTRNGEESPEKMHLNSNQEGVVSEDTNPVPVKNVSKNDEIEMLENKMEEGAICYNDTADSLVEYCIEKEDVEKLETKNEDNTINNDGSVLDCTVKLSDDVETEKKTPKIKVKDNLLERRAYENNSIVEGMKVREENNLIQENGIVSDEDNLMIDVDPADLQGLHDDDKDSETSQDSIELRLTNRKIKRGSARNSRDQEEINVLAAKKFKRQIDQTFIRRDRFIKDYFQRTDPQGGNPKENIKNVSMHMEQLMNEIKQLAEMSQQKEQEWNELIHLQKAKEELLLRLSRKRDIMMIHMKMEENKMGNSSSDYSMPKINYPNNTYNITNTLSKNMYQNLFSTVLPNMPNGDGLLKVEQQLNHLQNNTRNGITVMPLNNNTSNMQPKMRLPPQAHHNNLIKNGPMNHFNNLNNINHNQFILNQQFNNNGRQGQIKDVKSIIADYRQRHPEIVPKRGRRMKSVLQTNNVGVADGPHDASRLSELGLLLSNNEMNCSRPSSSESNDNLLLRNQHYQLNCDNSSPISLINDISRSRDISLHPIPINQEENGKQQSLLHGILSKKSQRNMTTASDSNTYTSTLARLLTAPERNTTSSIINHQVSTLAERLGGNISNRKTITLSNERIKRRCTEEITITPVENNAHIETSDMIKSEPKEEQVVVNLDTAPGEEDGGEEEEENPPACQGCNKSEAHYVCAGCSNQWYCSRECQVNAWEVHSEVCKG